MTTEGMGLAIAGDPRRPALARALFDIYRGYPFLDDVRLYFRRNPAQAFNAAARDMEVAAIVGTGGDVYVGENELSRFLGNPYPVLFATDPLTPRRHDTVPYPPAWWVRLGGFVSGLFCAPRELILRHPFPESPPFCEDSLFYFAIRSEVQPVGVNVPCVHVDAHPLFRRRTLQYAFFLLTRPEFRLGDRLHRTVKMLGWEWVDIWNAIHVPSTLEEEAMTRHAI